MVPLTEMDKLGKEKIWGENNTNLDIKVKERYTQLNAEFQRTARRGKKAFFNEQCKE